MWFLETLQGPRPASVRHGQKMPCRPRQIIFGAYGLQALAHLSISVALSCWITFPVSSQHASVPGSGHPELVGMLLEARAKNNIPDRSGRTALHLATNLGNALSPHSRLLILFTLCPGLLNWDVKPWALSGGDCKHAAGVPGPSKFRRQGWPHIP